MIKKERKHYKKFIHNENATDVANDCNPGNLNLGLVASQYRDFGITKEIVKNSYFFAS